MPKFIYKAKHGPHEVVRGAVEAQSWRKALEIIRGQGYFPIKVDEELRQTFASIGTSDVALFTHQLSDLLDSGLPVLKALELLGRQSENKSLQALLADVSAQVKEGKALSEALEAHPQVFPTVYVHILRAGELGGAVVPVLERLAGYYEREVEFRSRLQAAAAYPMLVALVGLGTVVFLLSFVIPRLGEIFGEMGPSLPWITRILLEASETWKTTWWAWLLGPALAGAAFWRMGPKGGILWQLPIWRTVAYKAALARFTRTLATLVSNGVPLLDALRVVSEGIDHPKLKNDILEAAAAVENGSPLAQALANRCPEVMCNMIAVGEEGGKLERSLDKIATTYDREFEGAIRLTMSMLEPAMILCVGSVVGLMVLAMLLPILEIHELVR